MKTLIAGFGNIFRCDDGFGCAVIRALSPEQFASDTRIRDFGTSGMQLALDMLTDYDVIVIVDAVWRDAPPGTVFAIASDEETLDTGTPADAHAMTINAALALYRRLREQSGVEREPKIVIVGCVPQILDDGMELSEPVRAAIPACVDLVRRVSGQYIGTGAQS
jgi:hydrogenase maturation protease